MGTQSAEYMQIKKYNGFYIGRYEAGVGTLNKDKKENGTEEEKNNPFDYSVTFNGNASLFGAVALQTGINSWGWQNYNFTARRTGTPVTTGSNKVAGNVVVKANSIPYYHADYYTALEMSERLYNEHNYVKSGLVTGTMWDMMMKYMKETGNIDITSSSWVNYDNVSLTNLNGYYTNVTTAGATDGFKSSETLTTNSGTSSYVLLTTGSTEQVKKMNLYDVAGNLWEWTEEASYADNLDYNMNATYNTYMLRSSSFVGAYATYPATFRAPGYAPNTNTNYGFRLALYLE